jgi:peptide-methionine (R)-S-oxide reductase
MDPSVVSTLSEEEWRKLLTPEQYRILREKDTEPPFTGVYVDEHAPGTYRCAACGNELFSSTNKFDSGSGWPSYDRPVDNKNIRLEEDTSFGMVRTAVTCARCGGHLGHVFDDRNIDSGKYYCINSACLALDANPKETT